MKTCSPRSRPLWEAGGACQGLGSLSRTRPCGQSITRLHTGTELTTSHRRTNPPYDSWGSSWPACERHRGIGTVPESLSSNLTSISATTVKPWPSHLTSLSLICRLSGNRNCYGRSSRPKHFHPHPPPHMAHPKARQDMEGALPLSTLRTSQPGSPFYSHAAEAQRGKGTCCKSHSQWMWDGIRTDPRLGNNSYMKPQTVLPQRLVTPQEQNPTCKSESTGTGWPRLIQFTARDSTTLVPARSLLAYDC